MAWNKVSNLRVRGVSQFVGAATFSALATLNAGGTVPQNQTLGLRGNTDLRGGTVRMPGGIGTAGIGTADLQAFAVSYGGGSARITSNIGGSVYVWLGIAQP